MASERREKHLVAPPTSSIQLLSRSANFSGRLVNIQRSDDQREAGNGDRASSRCPTYLFTGCLLSVYYCTFRRTFVGNNGYPLLQFVVQVCGTAWLKVLRRRSATIVQRVLTKEVLSMDSEPLIICANYHCPTGTAQYAGCVCASRLLFPLYRQLSTVLPPMCSSHDLNCSLRCKEPFVLFQPTHLLCRAKPKILYCAQAACAAGH